MNYIQVPKDAYDFLNTLRQKYPHYAGMFDSIDSSLNNRLWNQLSDDLILLTNQVDFHKGQDLVLLYNSLIITVEKAFNPMKLILIIQNVIKNFSGKSLYFIQITITLHR